MLNGQRFNASSHLAGLILLPWAAAWLVQHAPAHTDTLALAGATVFVAAAAVLLLTSVACHMAAGPLRHLWQRADHGAIFLLIAASYTPFALAGPRHAINLGLLAVCWLIALAAAARELAGPPLPPPLIAYVALGWGAVLAAAPVAARLSTDALAWLSVSAVCYTIGTFFFRSSRCRHAHGIWHLFVLAGIAANFAATHWLLQAQ